MLKATSGCILLWPVACLGPKTLLFFISLDVFVDNKLHFFSSLFWTKRKKYPRRNLSNITKIRRSYYSIYSRILIIFTFILEVYRTCTLMKNNLYIG